MLRVISYVLRAEVINAFDCGYRVAGKQRISINFEKRIPTRKRNVLYFVTLCFV